MEEEEKKTKKEEDIKENKQEEVKSGKTIFTREVIIALAIGLLLGLVTANLMHVNSAIAMVKGKSITQEQIYSKLEKYYTGDVLGMVLEEADNIILSKKYKEDDKMKERIKKEADKYIDAFIKYYGGTKEQFLKESGFESEEDFTNFLALDYKRNLYYDDYLAGLIGEEKIKEYYEKNVFAPINTKHILVKISDKMKEKEAKKIADEIIKKLSAKGADFDKIAEECKKEYGEKNIIVEDLGYLGFVDKIEKEFMDALKAMEDNSFSKEPVKTSYGFHIINRKDQKKDFTLEDARQDIIEKLASETELELEPKAKKLIDLRKEEGFKINNEKFAKKYKEICEKYEPKEENKAKETVNK